MDEVSVRLNVRVRYDAKSRHIKLAGKGLTVSTASNNPESKRYHPNLFRKLGKVLRDAEVPSPEIAKIDPRGTWRQEAAG